MPAVKMNISIESEVASTLRRRAAELGQPVSVYLTNLVRQEARRHQDELAAEGYQALASDMAEFVPLALAVANEGWPQWHSVEEAQDANR